MSVDSSGSDGGVGEAGTERRDRVNEGVLVLTGDLEQNKGGTISSCVAESSHKAITSGDTSGSSWWNARNVLGVLLFLGLTVEYLTRGVLSIAIVAIVSRNMTVTLNNDTCPVTNDSFSYSYVGMMIPSVHLMIAAWIPPKDKAKYSSIVMSGTNFGTVLAMAVGGWLCDTTFLGGWPSVFYIFGGLGVIWGILWFLLAHDLPEKHPRISPSELQYILEHRYYVKRDKVVAIPWRHIVTSVPCWATLTANFCYSFSYNTLLTELPTYFSNILHFDMSGNGLRSALPYAIQIVTSVLWGIFIHALHARSYVSLGVVRKLSTSIGLYVSAAGLVAMIWVACDPVWAIVVMCLAVGAYGPLNSGLVVSEQDIAPNFAGTLKGLSSTMFAAMAFVAPAVAGAITNNNQTLKAWNTIFIISASFNVFFCSVFVIFGTAEVQSWNYPQPRGEVSDNTISNQE